MVRVETKFKNGAVSVRLDDDRLVKLPGAIVDDLMNLIKPGGPVAGGALEPWLRYWRGERFFISGPNNEQVKQWDSQPLWQHRPYIDFVDFIGILECLHEKNLASYKNFVAGETGLFRCAKSYLDWQRRQGDRPGVYISRNPVATTFVSEEEFEQMRREMAEREC